jgi:hypothetical protein
VDDSGDVPNRLRTQPGVEQFAVNGVDRSRREGGDLVAAEPRNDMETADGRVAVIGRRPTLTVDETARLLRKGRKAVYDAIQDGKFRFE